MAQGFVFGGYTSSTRWLLLHCCLGSDPGARSTGLSCGSLQAQWSSFVLHSGGRVPCGWLLVMVPPVQTHIRVCSAAHTDLKR